MKIHVCTLILMLLGWGAHAAEKASNSLNNSAPIHIVKHFSQIPKTFFDHMQPQGGQRVQAPCKKGLRVDFIQKENPDTSTFSHVQVNVSRKDDILCMLDVRRSRKGLLFLQATNFFGQKDIRDVQAYKERIHIMLRIMHRIEGARYLVMPSGIEKVVPDIKHMGFLNHKGLFTSKRKPPVKNAKSL